MSTTGPIVVDNALTQNFTLEGVRVIHSEPHPIPKGYNAVITKARDDYMALFHDDCLINLWLHSINI